MQKKDVPLILAFVLTLKMGSLTGFYLFYSDVDMCAVSSLATSQPIFYDWQFAQMDRVDRIGDCARSIYMTGGFIKRRKTKLTNVQN